MHRYTPEDCIAQAAALSALAETRPEFKPEYLLMAEMWLRVSEVVERGGLSSLVLPDTGDVLAGRC